MSYATKSQLLLSICGGALTAGLLSTAASAQNAPAAASGAGVVQEVVVTAQRRSERAQDVPVAIQAYTAEMLAASGVQRYPDVANLTPGLTFQAAGASAVPFLRGVGAATTQSGQETGVALFVDDVYFPSAPSAMMSLNSVSDVTVLKGPQGTLFGRNATGGVVQITSRTPGRTPTFDGSIGYANYDTRELAAYAAGPIGSRVSADLAVYMHDQRDGWGTNLATGKDQFTETDKAYRSRWEFDLGEKTHLTAIGWNFQFKNNRGFASHALKPGELGQTEQYLGGYISNQGFYDTALDTPSVSSTDLWGGSIKLTQDVGFAEFRSISAYNHMAYFGGVDFDFTPRPLAFLVLPGRDDMLSQEFQLVSKPDPASKLSWVSGVYLYRDIGAYTDQLTFVPIGNPTNSVTHLDSRQKTNSWSIYGQATYKVLEDTNLTLGARYNDDGRDARITTRTVNPARVVTAIAGYSGANSFTAATWKVSLDHHFNESLMAYVGFTTGFKSGFYNSQTVQLIPGTRNQLLPVNPEKIRAVEGGFKSVLFDRRLRLNVSAFHYNYQDMQVNAFIDAATRVTLNAASAKIYGLDLDAEWHASDKLSFTLAAEALHARYGDFLNAPFFTPRPAPGTGLAVSIGDASGNKVPYSSPFTLALGADYVVPLADGKLDINGNVAYNEGFYFDPMNRLHQGNFALLNAQVKWTAPSGRYDLSIWGRNLGSAKVYSSVNPTAFGDAAEPRDPLTFGGRVGVHF